MKTNPIKQFIADVNRVLESLTKTAEVININSRCSARANHYLSINKVHARFTVEWIANTDFNNCAEWWFHRICCRLAHRDQCGSAEYVNLKKIAKKAYVDILEHFQKGDFKKENPYATFQINRKGIRLYFDLTADMCDSLLSSQLLEMKEGIISKIPKLKNGRIYSSEYDSEFFEEYVKTLSKELDIKDTMARYYN